MTRLLREVRYLAVASLCGFLFLTALVVGLSSVARAAPIHASVGPDRAASAVPDNTGPWAPPTASGVQFGTASWYGPGSQTAMPFCTWTYRHTTPGGCGWALIRSMQTGLVVVAPISDFCQCYVGTPQVRIIDLQLGVVAALGLDPAQGLYQVSVQVLADPGVPLVDTSMAP